MTGGCTTHIATAMLSTVNPPITPASYILDNAYGRSTVTTEIKSRHPAAHIMAMDLSPAMIAEVQESVQRNGWSDVETAVLDVRALTTLADDTFTHIFANLALPVPGGAESGVKIAREMFRVLEIGGVAMAATWAGGYPFLLSLL
jgi:ubiquinone/menaquinone biosynthesis C-methylase UbiE